MKEIYTDDYDKDYDQLMALNLLFPYFKRRHEKLQKIYMEKRNAAIGNFRRK